MVGHGASGKTSPGRCARLRVWKLASDTVPSRTAPPSPTIAPEEIERGFSINLGCAYAEWMDTKINLIDTPGFLDFQGDAIAGLAAADGALCVVTATRGVEVGTERDVPRSRASQAIPCSSSSSMMDKEHADFDRVYQQIKTRLTSKVIPVEIPIGAGRGLPRHRQSVHQEGAPVTSAASKTGEYEETDIPAGSQATVRPLLQRADRDRSRRPTTRCSSATSRAARSRATKRSRR